MQGYFDPPVDLYVTQQTKSVFKIKGSSRKSITNSNSSWSNLLTAGERPSIGILDKPTYRDDSLIDLSNVTINYDTSNVDLD